MTTLPGETTWRLKTELNEKVGVFLMLGPDQAANERRLLDVYDAVVALAEHLNVTLNPEGDPE